MTAVKTARIRTIRAAAALTLLLGTGVATAAVAASQPTSSETPVTAAPVAPAVSPVPPALAPPAGQVEIAHYSAEGVQVYQCTAGAWVFVEPAATLKGKVEGVHGSRQAIHFRGPSWESLEDGSLVEAKAVANSPVTGSIPQLLLQATRNRGDGDFGKVSYIQRLRTSGGAAPAGTCTDGATSGVPYQAEYRFFAPAV
jgi:hypothetical protein